MKKGGLKRLIKQGDVPAIVTFLKEYTVLDKKGAIFDAVVHERLDILRLLLADTRFDPNIWDSAPLRHSVKYGLVACTRALLEDERVTRVFPVRFVIEEAIFSDQPETLYAVLNHTHFDPSCDDNYLIRCACDANRTNVVRALLRDSRVNPTMDNNICLRQAACRGNAEILRALLSDPRVDPGDNDNDALCCAIEQHHPEIVRSLLDDNRIDPSRGHDRVLRFMAFYGENAEFVTRLLADPRVDPKTQGDYPIYFASKNGHADIVRVLLRDSRVDPSEAIAHTKHNRIAKLLLADPRVDPTVQDNRLVRRASSRRREKLLKRLLKDPRIDGSCAIPGAQPGCVRILAKDPVYGIHAYRAMYEKHHSYIVSIYDSLLSRVCVLMWISKQRKNEWCYNMTFVVERLMAIF